MDETKEVTALQTLDGVPMHKGMRVYLVCEGYVDEYRHKIARPEAATVLRISDGQERSVLLRIEDGRETRWHPKEGEIASRGLFAKLDAAKRDSKLRNQDSADAEAKSIRARIAKRADFLRRCGLKETEKFGGK